MEREHTSSVFIQSQAQEKVLKNSLFVAASVRVFAPPQRAQL